MTRFAGSDSAMQSLFGKMSNITPGETEDLGVQARSATRNAMTEGDAMVDMAGINAEATLAQAAAGASAIKAGGEAQAQAGMMGGISSGIAGIAGGFGSMGNSGGAAPATGGYGKFANSMNANPFASGSSFNTASTFNPPKTSTTIPSCPMGLSSPLFLLAVKHS